MRTKAETLAKVEIDARGNKQENLEAYVVLDTMADKLAELEVLTVNETLAKTQLTLLQRLAHKEVQVESETTGETVN